MKNSFQPGLFYGRDGTQLSYYLHVHPQPRGVMILLPGFALGSEDYLSFCQSLVKMSHLLIYSVDLRGHRLSEKQMADVAYVGQLRDDLEDLLIHVRKRYPSLPLVICAHSGASSLAIDYLASCNVGNIAALFLIAPVFSGYMEFNRQQNNIYRLIHYSRYWCCPPTPVPSRLKLNHQFRFSLFRYLLGCFLTCANGIRLISVRRSISGPWKHFTYRFLESYGCSDLQGQLAKLTIPVWMVIGMEDEFVLPEAAVSTVRWHVAPDTLREIRCLSSLGHFTVLAAGVPLISYWFNSVLLNSNVEMRESA